jgi:two-component system chemotaxis response regulator CheB
MLAEQSNQVEEAMWAALRSLEESASLSRRLINRAHQNGQERVAKNFAEKLQRTEHHAAVIKQLLNHE